MHREAACQCGQLRLQCSGEPIAVALCHCLDCQRRTGSLFGAGAFYAKDKIAILAGQSVAFTRGSDRGFSVTGHFCGTCGSTVWWEPEWAPHLAGVAVGAFADPDFPMPTLATWDKRQHPWLHLPTEIGSHREGVVRPPSP